MPGHVEILRRSWHSWIPGERRGLNPTELSRHVGLMAQLSPRLGCKSAASTRLLPAGGGGHRGCFQVLPGGAMLHQGTRMTDGFVLVAVFDRQRTDEVDEE